MPFRSLPRPCVAGAWALEVSVEPDRVDNSKRLTTAKLPSTFGPIGTREDN